MTALDPHTPVVILGASHNPALGLVRSLGRLGVNIVGIGTDPASPIHLSRYFTEIHLWDILKEPPAASCEFLTGLARRLGDRPLLLATYDDGVLFIAQHAAALAPAFRLLRQPFDVVHACCNKRALFELLSRLNLPTAYSAFPAGPADLEPFLARARFPVIVKGIDGPRLERRCGLKHFIVHSADELRRRYAEREDPAAPNLMFQEFIPGRDDDMWLFDGYFDSASQCRLAFTGRKLRQAPIHSGAASFGLCTWNQTVADHSLAFVRAIGYAGIVDIDFRYDARDGQYKLLDPNPRIGSTFRLFVAQGGLDVAQACYRDLTDQPVPADSPVEGRTWLVEDTDLLAAIGYWREGTLRLREWLASRRRATEVHWFAPDDSRPHRRMRTQLAGTLGRAVLRRVGRVLTA